MTPRFSEAKATQIAGMLLKLRGGKMHYLKLLKLMYLIDREGLLRWGWSITNDRYVSMNKGLLLSRTYDLITLDKLGASYWREFISAPLGEFEVELRREPESDELSEAERALVEEIYENKRFGYQSRWDLVDYTHELPEYIDPKGSSLQVDYADVLRAAGKSDAEVFEVVNDLEEVAMFEYALST